MYPNSKNGHDFENMSAIKKHNFRKKFEMKKIKIKQK